MRMSAKSAPSPRAATPDDRGGASRARGKLAVYIGISAIGMSCALVFHAYCDRILHADYPLNSLLFVSRLRFSDLTDVLFSARRLDPYSTWALYFPFAYIVAYPFAALPPAVAIIIYLAVTAGLLVRVVHATLRQASFAPATAAPLAVAVLGLAYPVWFCADRGNVELTLLLLICVVLLAMRRRNYFSAAACLASAVCLKLYPIVLICLFARRRAVRFAVGLIAASVVVSAFSLLAFKGTPAGNIARWRAQTAEFHRHYVLGNRGMGGSAGWWNAYKVVAIQRNPEAALRDPRGESEAWQAAMARPFRRFVLVVLVCGGGVALFTLIVETSVWRQAALLLLYMVLSAPAGAEYKLVHCVAVIVSLVVAPWRRAGDTAAVALVSLAMVPKRYVFFESVITDVGAADCSIGVLVNPALLTVAALVLVWQGMAYTTAKRRYLRMMYALTRLPSYLFMSGSPQWRRRLSG